MEYVSEMRWWMARGSSKRGLGPLWDFTLLGCGAAAIMVRIASAEHRGAPSSDNRRRRVLAMLTRLYVDNFRCLTNFDLTLRPLMLFLGENGVGKSKVLEVLTVLRRVLQGSPLKWLTADTRSRWSRSPRQQFELDIEGPLGTFEYRLIVTHREPSEGGPPARITEETLRCAGRPLVTFSEGMVTVVGDDQVARPAYPLAIDQSAVGAIVASERDQGLLWFREYVKGLALTSLNPYLIKKGIKEGESQDEASRLARHGQNFTSWYRYLSQAHPDRLFDLRTRLQRVLPGFHSLRFGGGSRRTLEAGFKGEDGVILYYRLSELSDGQVALLVLYTLLYVLRGQPATLFIDEPQDHIALAEVQPFLNELCAAVEDGGGFQVLLISHHPELIDLLGHHAGVWLERNANGGTRVVPGPPRDDSGLRLSERVARRWLP